MAWRQRFCFLDPYTTISLEFPPFLLPIGLGDSKSCATQIHRTFSIAPLASHLHTTFLPSSFIASNLLLFFLFHLAPMYRTNQGLEIKQGRLAFLLSFYYLVMVLHRHVFCSFQFTFFLFLSTTLSPSVFLNFFFVYATCWAIVSLGQVIDLIFFYSRVGKGARRKPDLIPFL